MHDVWHSRARGKFWATVCLLSNRCLCVGLVTLACCGQTVGCVKMPLGTQVGLSPGHTVLDGVHGDPASPKKRTAAPLHFLAHICCGQMAEWIKMPLGMDVGLSPIQ